MPSEHGPNHSVTRAHLILLTSAFPFGSREEFLEDEIPTLAAHFVRLTVVSEDVSGAARSLPANCRAIGVTEADATPRWRLLLPALRCLVAERKEDVGLRKGAHMLRAILYYLRKASAITHATQQHLRRTRDALPVCFYSYWMDHKALAATELTSLHARSIAVSRTHGYDLYADRHPYCYLPLRRHIATRLTAVFPVSDAGACELRRQVLAEVNVITARLGVPPSGSRLQEQPSVPSGGTLVVSVGSLIPLKRAGLLIEALRTFGPESGISWRHFGDGPLRESLVQKAAADLRIPHSLPGYVPHGDLRQTLRLEAGHSILISTSASEGIPVSMMEAMAAGIPCIGTRVGGVAEIVQDGVNGYLLPAQPAAAEVWHALERFLQLPPPEKLKMRQAAFETWSTRFDASKNYASFAEQLGGMMRDA